jgi:hypothetical protein
VSGIFKSVTSGPGRASAAVAKGQCGQGDTKALTHSGNPCVR